MKNNRWNSLFRTGAICVLLQLGATLLASVAAAAFGTRPESIQEFFAMYQANKISGLLQDELGLLLLIGLYLGTFPALFMALRKENEIAAGFATLFTFIAVTTCFASHSGFAMMTLSDQYAAASSEAQRAQLLAAGEAVLASDMWHSTAGYMSGLLLQGSGVIISLVMLRSKNFSRITAISGLVSNGVDLFQHILHPFTTDFSAIALYLAGPFYLVWYIMLARDLFRLAKNGLDESPMESVS